MILKTEEINYKNWKTVPFSRNESAKITDLLWDFDVREKWMNFEPMNHEKTPRFRDVLNSLSPNQIISFYPAENNLRYFCRVKHLWKWVFSVLEFVWPKNEDNLRNWDNFLLRWVFPTNNQWEMNVVFQRPSPDAGSLYTENERTVIINTFFYHIEWDKNEDLMSNLQAA